MKRIFKYLAFFAFGVSLCQCTDNEILDNYRPAVSGDEVTFGATAFFKNGSRNTRTEYGDINAQRDQIAINWVEGDLIDIVGEQCAEGRRKATYKIKLDSNTPQNEATRLSKLGDYGLQWGSETVPHDFYAVYPSEKSFTSKEQEARQGLRFISGGIEGYMPLEIEHQVQRKGNVLLVQPNMKYAYMYAHTCKSLSEANEEGGVPLSFNPMVTAIQIQLETDKFNASSKEEISLISMDLVADNGKAISGTFSFNFVDHCFKLIEPSSRIKMSFSSPVSIRQGDLLDATFFALPTTSLDADDLALQIHYKKSSADGIFVKTVRFGIAFQSGKKYLLKGIQMPDLTEFSVSNWFSAINDNAYISQLSVPVATNAFSYLYGDDFEDAQYRKEQVVDYEKLWDIGVRGFEFKNSYSGSESRPNIGDSHFVMAGQAFSGKGSVTFKQAFETLYRKLKDPKNQDEALFLICTYQSYEQDHKLGYRPDLYLKGLELFLSDFCRSHSIANKDDLFIKLGTDRTVGDLRGKIAIVVRLCDYDYVRTIGRNPLNLQLTEWDSHVAYIRDWGTSIDNWDVRYGGGKYYREGFYNSVNDGRQTLEDKIFGACAANNTSGTPSVVLNQTYNWTPKGIPTYDRDFSNYYFDINHQGNRNALVQCWERIFTENIYYTGRQDNYWDLAWNNATAYLWYQWPESLEEKKEAILNCMHKSMATRGKSSDMLFINSLSGYFADRTLPGSLEPHMKKKQILHHQYIAGNDLRFSTELQVTGGDYRSCAAELNSFAYKEISKMTNEELGPLGLVMLDYIGASRNDFKNLKRTSVSDTDAEVNTAKLLDFILLNNTRFPMLQKKMDSSK